MVLPSIILLLLLAAGSPATAQLPQLKALQELPEFTEEPVTVPLECQRNVGCPRPPGIAGVGLLACTTYLGNGECEGLCGYSVVSYLEANRACPPFVWPSKGIIEGMKRECRKHCTAAQQAIEKRKTDGLFFAPAVVFAALDGNGTSGSYGNTYRGGFKLYKPMHKARNRCKVFVCDKPEGCIQCPENLDDFVQACWYCEWTGTICDSACLGPKDRWQFEL